MCIFWRRCASFHHNFPWRLKKFELISTNLVYVMVSHTKCKKSFVLHSPFPLINSWLEQAYEYRHVAPPKTGHQNTHSHVFIFDFTSFLSNFFTILYFVNDSDYQFVSTQQRMNAMPKDQTFFLLFFRYYVHNFFYNLLLFMLLF